MTVPILTSQSVVEVSEADTKLSPEGSISIDSTGALV